MAFPAQRKAPIGREGNKEGFPMRRDGRWVWRSRGDFRSRRSGRGAELLLAPLLLLMLSGVRAQAQAQAQALRVLIPLYARPESDYWKLMVSAAQNTTVSYSVVVNPASGPGNFSEPAYTTGITALVGAGVEVLCYVPTGFGMTEISAVKADIDAFESFYPGLCAGFFFDEGPGTEENTWKYTEYYNHVQRVTGDDSAVVVNPGIRPHDSLYNIGDRYASNNPNKGGQVVITSYENKFGAFYDGSKDYRNQEVPFPPRYLDDRYMHSILVYDAFYNTLVEFLDSTIFKLYCANWGYVFFTDDSFGDDGNPWDDLPSYFMQLLGAVEKATRRAGQCGTFAPTPAPSTLSPLAPGETRAPVPTPSPTEFSTPQPAVMGGTRAPMFYETPAPTLAPTPSPTLAPTPSPTLPPVAVSGAARRECTSYSGAVSAVLRSGAVLLAATLLFGVEP